MDYHVQRTEDGETIGPQVILDKVLNALPDIVVITDGGIGTDSGPRIEFVNQAFGEFLGKHPQDIVGLPVSQFLKSYFGDATRTRFRTLITQGSPAQTRLVRTQDDGAKQYVEFHVVPILDPHGQLKHMIGVGRDVTQQCDALAKAVESEAYYRAIFDQSPHPVMIFSPAGEILSCNQAVLDRLGINMHELRKKSFAELVHPSDLQASFEHFKEAACGKTPAPLVARGRNRDGEYVEAAITDVPIVLDGKIVAVVAMMNDLTQLRRLEERLRLSANALANIAEAAVITTPDLSVISANRAFTSITGYMEAEFVGRSPLELWADDADQPSTEEVRLAIERDGYWQGETKNRRKSGETYPSLTAISAVRDQQDRITHFVGVFSDVSKFKAYEERLEHLAHHDSLTNLPNRAMFECHVNTAISRSKRNGKPFALMFLDLDQFKAVNDSLGHRAGDELLRSVAKRLSESLRGTDVVARLGGDEFGMLLGDLTSSTDAARVAEKVLTALSTPHLQPSYELFTSASVGLAIYPDDGEEPLTLLKNADAAMYLAKKEGRNTYRFFSADINAKAHEYLVLANNLRHALERNEFHLLFQPVVDLSTGRIIGAEALLRWTHPESGLVSPATFIPIAETTGLIGVIGEWVLYEACRQATQWQRLGHPPVRVAVNLSARQFREPGLVEKIEAVLAETGLAPQWLELEITETMMMENPERVKTILGELHARGISIAIDDFGTGYSSLSYLKAFPCDFVKIDRSFIDGVPKDQNDITITETVIGMAQRLGMRVIAEGIETSEQLEFLRRGGCEEGQGFLFSKPLPPGQIAKLLGQTQSLFPLTR